MADRLGNLINSLKGVSGTGDLLARLTQLRQGFGRLTLEPGDFVRNDDHTVLTTPTAFDLWYLWCHDNVLAHYYRGTDQFQPDHFDYTERISEALWWLQYLPGLKPLKTLRNLDQIVSETSLDIDSLRFQTEWKNNGTYWINTMAFETWGPGFAARYPSDGPAGNMADYVGYVTFPVGQLGVMEVISLVQETDLAGYQFHAADESPDKYRLKPELSDVPKGWGPVVPSVPQIFCPVEGAATNLCAGRHFIESSYLRPDATVPNQNLLNSRSEAAYASTAARDVELLSAVMEQYPEKADMKKWVRFWIHRDSTLPVPGEFLAILCKPAPVTPHVSWFQESFPFVYAGNWMETTNLSSGFVVDYLLEDERTDGGVGPLYTVNVQGVPIYAEASDFYDYAVGDRVALLKKETTQEAPQHSFAWLDQEPLTQAERMQKSSYVIVPFTYYKLKQ